METFITLFKILFWVAVVAIVWDVFRTAPKEPNGVPKWMHQLAKNIGSIMQYKK